MKYIIITVCMALLSGCASTGSAGNGVLHKKGKAEIYQLIQDNVVTKSDAIKVFGDPDDIDYYENTGQEKWIYNHLDKSSLLRNYIPIVNFFSNGTEDERKKIILIFDKQGILIKSIVSNSVGMTKGGLFN